MYATSAPHNLRHILFATGYFFEASRTMKWGLKVRILITTKFLSLPPYGKYPYRNLGTGL